MKTYIKYVTFDCSDPVAQSAFWAEATGFVPVMLTEEFAALAAPDDLGLRGILFWKVPEPKTSKSRMHVDLAADDPAAEVERLVALGATKVVDREGLGTTWTVMLDPEGNEFCIEPEAHR